MPSNCCWGEAPTFECVCFGTLRLHACHLAVAGRKGPLPGYLPCKLTLPCKVASTAAWIIIHFQGGCFADAEGACMPFWLLLGRSYNSRACFVSPDLRALRLHACHLIAARKMVQIQGLCLWALRLHVCHLAFQLTLELPSSSRS